MPRYNRSDEECEGFLARRLSHYHVVRLNERHSTPGRVDRNGEFDYLGIRPQDLKGRSVLDIGALDGVISFNAERNDAERVLAIDVEDYELYDWGWGGAPAKLKGLGEVKNKVFPQLREFFDSMVLRKQKTVYDLSPGDDGIFDFVFFYGVLYHLRHPLLSFDKIRSVCTGGVLVETHICNIDRQLPSSIFYLDDVLDKAVTNWTGPTEACVVHWMRNAGFRSVWVEKKQRMISRQRFIGFVAEPTFKVSDNFQECGVQYFAESRRAVEYCLKIGSFGPPTTPAVS